MAEKFKPIVLEQKESLETLAQKLYVVDHKIEDINRAQMKFNGTDKAFQDITGIESRMDVEDVLNAMSTQEDVEKLRNEAIGIIQKMRTIDPTVEIEDVFIKYGF